MLNTTLNYECRWTVKHFRAGKLIWELRDFKNMLVNEGQKSILDTYFRARDSVYFGSTNFYIGLCNGSVSKTTILSTIPNEPAVAFGYSRLLLERSVVGWPVIEMNEGDWRIVSKELEFSAVGGDFSAVNGAFLATSSDNVGSLVGSLTFGIEREILAGDSCTVQLRAKIK